MCAFDRSRFTLSSCIVRTLCYAYLNRSPMREDNGMVDSPAIGDVVRFVPRASYGIRWSEKALTEGYVARITRVSPAYPTGVVACTVQRRDVGDYPYHDCHWGCDTRELFPLVEES